MYHTPSDMYVSTHSRLKAAGFPTAATPVGSQSFNTQPPEGGWAKPQSEKQCPSRFNTQPPEGGWIANRSHIKRSHVSTHSRLKAAGPKARHTGIELRVSTHSRLKAAGEKCDNLNAIFIPFQHTAA